MRAQIQAALISSAWLRELEAHEGLPDHPVRLVPEHPLEPGDGLLGSEVLLLHALGELHRDPGPHAVHEREGREAQELDRGEKRVQAPVDEIRHAGALPVELCPEAELVEGGDEVVVTPADEVVVALDARALHVEGGGQASQERRALEQRSRPDPPWPGRGPP